MLATVPAWVRCLLILFVSFHSLSMKSATECETCDIETIKVTQENITNLNFKIVKEFLCTFDETCKEDLEFARWSNETLFDVVHNAPELFLKVLQFGGLNNQDLILNELESPVHSGINVPVIRNKVKKLDDKYMFKYDVLSALK